MRKVLQVASFLALVGIVVPPILYFTGELPQHGMKIMTSRRLRMRPKAVFAKFSLRFA